MERRVYVLLNLLAIVVLLAACGGMPATTITPPPTEAARLLGQEGPPVVVETLGKQGAMVMAKERITRCPAFPVAGVRDSTGAGDALAAGLVAGFLEGLDWEASARLGNAVAALKISLVGARSGLPTRDEVACFITSFPKGEDL
jgi:sugar/nucleoside kinase (ribokinase family)